MIIDASVAFKWIVPESDSDAALTLLGPDLAAPYLIVSEVGNAIRKRVRRGEMRWAATLAADLARLSRLVDLQDEAEHIARALELAHQLDHAIYDCVYLALAEARREMLVTADQRFAEKVAKSPFTGLVRGLEGYS